MSAKVLPHPAAIARSYESGATHSAMPGWIYAAVPADVDIRSGLRQLRARARDAEQNDDHMLYFLGLVEDNIVGASGICIQPKPRRPGGSIDKTSAKRIEEAFDEQCERGVWDVTGGLSRCAFDSLGARTVARDGEALIRIHEGDPESPTGFAVELIDPEALDIDYNAIMPNGNIVRMGVEMTPRRRPVAYHLFSEPDSPWGGYRSTYASARRVRIPATDILHVFLPRLVWGTRGVPWAHTALRRMKMLSGYEEAAITAARAAAAKSAAYVSTPDAAVGTGPAGQQTDDGRFVQTIEPGAIEQVPYGWDLKPLDWAWPNTEHGAFVKAALRGISCGLGVSYNALANDLEGVNYSSLRSGALQERSMWMRLQAWWIECASKPIYRRWVAYALRSGRVTRANGDALPLDRIAALSDATFQGRRWPWVDPMKDLQANELAIKLRTRSISSIIRESGYEPDEVWEELHEDMETLAALGIPLQLDSAAKAQTPQTSGAGGQELPEEPEENPDPLDPEEGVPDA